MQIRNWHDSRERYFSPGLGVLYQFRQDEGFRLHAGARFGLDISRRVFHLTEFDYDYPYPIERTERVTYTDVFAGPVFGARYYLSDNFAVSGEFQVEAIFYDLGVSEEDYRNVGNLSISTAQVLAVYLYF